MCPVDSDAILDNDKWASQFIEDVVVDRGEARDTSPTHELSARSSSLGKSHEGLLFLSLSLLHPSIIGALNRSVVCIAVRM